MNLQQQLQKKKEELRASFPAEANAGIERAIDEQRKANFSAKGLQVGNVVPGFSLTNATGKRVSLDELLRKGPVIINFYRGGWCPYCNLELLALQRALPEIKALGGQLIAITPESPDNSLSTAEKHKLTFEVLSDRDNKVAKLFGIAFEIPPYLRKVFEGFGLDLSKHNASDAYQLPLPATYIVNQDKTIVLAFASEDFRNRASISDILKALKEVKSLVY